jgi:hypothetical protein
VHDRVYVRACRVDRAVNVAFAIGRPRIVLGLAVERAAGDVFRLDEFRAARPRDEKTLRPLGIADADVTGRVDDLFVRENAVRDDELADRKRAFRAAYGFAIFAAPQREPGLTRSG